jgi:hypothetical protein
MKEFLRLEDFVLVNSNTAADKPYAALYMAFKQMPLPKAYVEAMYNTKFARHFYTEQEIQGFVRRWSIRDEN